MKSPAGKTETAVSVNFLSRQQEDKLIALCGNGEGMIPIQESRELVEFLADSFPVTDKEAEILMGYMDGHGYMFAKMGTELYRGDLCEGPNDICWEEYTIEEAINDICELNYEMLQQSQMTMRDAENFYDFQLENDRYADLQREEKILDGLFDRTKYGKMIEAAAAGLADELIRSLEQENGIDGAVRHLKEGIAEIRKSSGKVEEEKRERKR